MSLHGRILVALGAVHEVLMIAKHVIFQAFLWAIQHSLMSMC
jgi:hypothetical protein